MFPNEKIYVRNVASPSDTIKSLSELLNLDGKDKSQNRQMFELIKIMLRLNLVFLAR